MSGRVVRGHGRGRRMGFPTINVDVAEQVPHGIYAGRVRLAGKTYPAAVHVGPVPTFEQGAVSVEAHLVGFSGQCYGRRAEVALVRRLRPIQTFEDADALARAIAEDVARVRALADEGGA